MADKNGYNEYYNNLIRKYEIQKDTLRVLAYHKDSKEEEKSKCEAVIRFIEQFQEDLRDLKNLPF